MNKYRHIAESWLSQRRTDAYISASLEVWSDEALADECVEEWDLTDIDRNKLAEAFAAIRAAGGVQFSATDHTRILRAIENDPEALKAGVKRLFNCREVRISPDLNGGQWVWISIDDPQHPAGEQWLGMSDLAVVSRALNAGDI